MSKVPFPRRRHAATLRKGGQTAASHNLYQIAKLVRSEQHGGAVAGTPGRRAFAAGDTQVDDSDTALCRKRLGASAQQTAAEANCTQQLQSQPACTQRLARPGREAHPPHPAFVLLPSRATTHCESWRAVHLEGACPHGIPVR